MDKDAFIFIGRSGCGKGTQKDLLIKRLETLGMKYLSVYTGESFRKFSTGPSFIAQKIKKILATGELAPSFIASTMWSEILMEQYKENQSLIFDGTPRTVNEAVELEDALQFLDFIHPTVVYINVSNKWAKERLLARGRSDDTNESIDKRLGWFDSTVMNVVNYCRTKSLYQFIEVNGEQTIDGVSMDIMRALPYLNKETPGVINRSYSYVSSPTSGNMPSNNQNADQNQNLS